MDMQLTSTEKMLAEIKQSDNHLTHMLWGHPLFSVTNSQLSQPLTSIDSAPLADMAKQLFQNIQMFIFHQMSGQADHSFHGCVMQDVIGVCLANVALQDEAYCQVLRQITGHQPPVSWQVAQVSQYSAVCVCVCVCVRVNTVPCVVCVMLKHMYMYMWVCMCAGCMCMCVCEFVCVLRKLIQRLWL